MKFFVNSASTMAFVLCMGVAAALAPSQARAQLYTTYNFSASGFNWVTCGSTPQQEGCFGSGTVSGFGHLCAILSDRITGSGSKSVQHIYAVDGNATGKNDVVLHYVRREVTVDQSGYATTTFTDIKDVGLPLTGGNTAACYAADNDAVIAAGTSLSTNAALVQKKTLAASAYGGFSPPEDMIGIAADASGNITMNFSGGFYLVGPTGAGLEDGGANAFVIPEHNALIP